MPSGGHNRKPDHLKLIEGTLRKDRSNPDAPVLEPEIPTPSDSLPKEAREEYFKLAELLNEMRVLTKADQGELENLALVRTQIKTLSKKIFKKSDMSEFRKIQIALNDAIRISSALSMKFGLSPSDRGRVSALPKKEESKWNNLGG